ncbi:hypothetical protein [Haloferula sargassicola]|uniref:Glycosyltransferase family 1 protein n=1 Tax=Haloferula sargassicola TaxID=490096 RepID=A0ABP9UQT5_9BACT
MRIATVHYHLRPGGVTEVIRQNHRILTAAGISHEIHCGHNPSDLPAIVDPALDYGGNPFIGALASAGALLHFHNPCLGKNPTLTRLLPRLAERGEAMLLQHHDLAEDGRPELLAALDSVEMVYPFSSRIGHAFINSRDRDLFLRAGLPEDRAFLLPNPSTPLDLPPPPAGPACVLCPMRGLPRKNLGELLLLAACAPAGTRFLQGSAPRNAAWTANYDGWRSLADTLGLPIEFDVFARGRDAAFKRSTHLLTTSTQEGFGMIHLEAAHQRRVLGRRIPWLAADLVGFPDDGLYDALLIDGRDFPTWDLETQHRLIVEAAQGHLDPEVIMGRGSAPLRTWLSHHLPRRRPADASAALARHRDEAHLLRLTAAAGILLDSPPGPVTGLDRSIIAAFFS